MKQLLKIGDPAPVSVPQTSNPIATNHPALSLESKSEPTGSRNKKDVKSVPSNYGRQVSLQELFEEGKFTFQIFVLVSLFFF